jgi:hypothetical protein
MSMKATYVQLYVIEICDNGGVGDRVVKVVDFKPLALHRCGFESRRRLLLCEEATQVAFGTSVVQFVCPFVPEKIMYGRASEGFLHQ